MQWSSRLEDNIKVGVEDAEVVKATIYVLQKAFIY